jgi:hypothetical protein
MKFLIKTAVILIVAFSFQAVNAQTKAKDAEEVLSLNSGTIDSQFEYVFKKSGNFKGTRGLKYEAVKYTSLLALKAHVLDSLKTTYAKLETSNNLIDSQSKEIEELKSKLGNTQNNLDQTNSEKDNISLFGMQMSKASYKVLMWSVIAGLFALLLFFILKFKGSNSATNEARHKLSEVESEFEEHRRTALEREQKVRRQLQDELNKHKS